MAAVLSLEALRTRFGPPLQRIEPGRAPSALPLGWPELDALLPDGGLPKGVVELSAPHALGGATSVALAAVRAAQQRDARAWCAWIDPEASLYAPGVAMAGVDLARLFVVRPPRADLGRIGVKVASAKAFDVVVIDVDPVPGARKGKHDRLKGELFVRKLALAAEEGGASILLLTDALASRPVPWPVALRLELTQAPDGLFARVAKDRRGRVSPAKTKVPLSTRPRLQEAG